MTRRRAILTAVGLIALIAVALVLFFAWPHSSANRASQLPGEVKQQLAATQVGQTSEQIMKPGRAITTMVGPGTEAWWNVETRFVQSWGLQPRWREMAQKPTGLGFTLFYSGENPNQRFATPALFLAYPDEKTAQAAVAAYNTGALRSVSSQYQALRLGSTAVVVPTSVYTDQVFNHTLDFVAPKASSPKLASGYWVVNAAALDTYVKRQQSEEDRSAYLAAIKALGFDTSATSGTWTGRSKDGLNWRGELSAPSTQLWHPTAVNPTQFYKIIASTAKRVGAPTQAQLDEAQAGGTDPNQAQTFFFTVVPRQSVIAEYFAIASGGKVAGKFTELRGGKTVSVQAPQDQREVVYTVEPNVWFNSFLSPDSGDIWLLFGFKKATLTFYKNDVNRLDITLTPST